jgi:O-antigen/teichoic acid export membrane protein
MAVMTTLNTILLSKLTSETEVGFYGAAAQLMMPLQILYQSVVVSIFPLMCQKFNLDALSLKRITEYLTELLLTVAVPAAVGLFFFSDFALQLLYGIDFLPASKVLRISAWSLIPIALAVALGQTLFASLREKVTLRITLVNIAVSLVLGVILIGHFGLVGAAITGLLTRIVDFAQHYFSVSKLLSGLSLPRIAWKPLVAGLGLAAYLTLAKNQSPLLLMTLASFIYISILLVLIIWSNGGYGRFKRQMVAWYFDRA